MAEIIRDILYILITGVGMVLVKYLINLIDMKINDVQANITIADKVLLNQSIDKAQDAIKHVVLAVSQEYVDTLKTQGKFDEQAQTEAKNKAIAKAEKLITDESRNAIITIYGDFDEYLDSMIESYVQSNKKAKDKN